MDVTSSVDGTRSRRRGRRKNTRKAAQEGGDGSMSVEKAPAVAVAPASVPAPAPVGVELKPLVGGAKKPLVVLAPPKKKAAKVVLVPKGAAVVKKPIIRKTFKARKVRVTIDNTSKTHKRKHHLLRKVDTMTDEQVREAVVKAKLSRAETVKSAPVPLLRQMYKDYHTMRGMFL